jgi:hypothetical protein
MENNFDLKKFLVENKLTTNSRMVNEGTIDEGLKDWLVGLGMTVLSIGGGLKFLAPSPEDIQNKQQMEKIVNAQKDALDQTSDEEVTSMIKSLEESGLKIWGNFIKIAPSTFDRYQDNREALDQMINQEQRKVIEQLLNSGKEGFAIQSNGSLTWIQPGQISGIKEQNS